MSSTILDPGDIAVNNTDKKPLLPAGFIPNSGRETNIISQFCSMLEGMH